LRALEKEEQRLSAAEEHSLQYPRLVQLEQLIRDAEQAVDGLTKALLKAPTERRLGLQSKLDGFITEQHSLLQERERLTQASPLRQRRLQICAELQQLRGTIGLDHEEVVLGKLCRQQGQQSGESGRSFEQQAQALTESCVVDDLLRRSKTCAALRQLRVLHGVTLGAARIEFDQLVIRHPHCVQKPVEVLAAVEVKRNINDLAHGFHLRQENLAWLTGHSDRYDPKKYRTAYFRSGHFDREALHWDGGESFRFGLQSFRRFRRDATTKHFLDRMYFITQPGMMWGVSMETMARICFHVAMDERWQPDSDMYIKQLLRWSQSLASPVETPDILQLYSATPRWSRQILFVPR
jgi:hypothetical protein